MNFSISSQNTIEQDINDIEYSDDLRSIKIQSDEVYCNNNCTVLLVLHISCGNKLFSKFKNVMSKDINDTMSIIDSGMHELRSQAENFKIECERDSHLDDNITTSKETSSYNSGKQDYQDNASPPGDNEKQFKPPIDVTQHKRNRMSSSTTSSSNNTNSIVINRPSTTSTFSSSIISELKTDSDEQIIIPETPESHSDRLIEETMIEKEEDSESDENVYAKWKTDKFFYSGKVKSSGPECEIIFDDDSSAMVKISDVYFMERLPEGTEVSVDVEGNGNFIKNFIINKHIDLPKFGAKPEKGYSVFHQVTHNYFDVPRKCVSVHMDIIRKLMVKDNDLDSSLNETLDASNISMENIVFGKRIQKRKRFSQFLTYDFKPKICHSPSIGYLSEFSLLPKKKRSININLPKSEKEHKEIGVFTNCYFMLTGDQDEDDPNISKESVEQKITENNGCVIEIPSPVLMKKYKHNELQLFLVVIGKQAQTVEFMMTLAIGQVPIVPSKWLYTCIEKSKLLDCEPFLLPRGSIGDCEPYSINLVTKSKPGVFVNKNIWIVTDSTEVFGKNWQNILELAEADVFLMDTSIFSSSISKQNCDFVIVERDGVTNNVLRKLKNLDLTVLDYSFATDCLISNQLISMEIYLL